MVDLDVRRQGWQQVMGRADGADLAVLHHQQTVFEIFIGRFDPNFGGVGEAVEQGGAVGFACQGHEELLNNELTIGLATARGRQQLGNRFGAGGVLAEIGVIGGDDFTGDGDGDFHR